MLLGWLYGMIYFMNGSSLLFSCLYDVDTGFNIYAVISSMLLVLFRHVVGVIGVEGINSTSVGIGFLLLVLCNPATLWAMTSGYLPLGVLVFVSVMIYLSLSALLTWFWCHCATLAYFGHALDVATTA